MKQAGRIKGMANRLKLKSIIARLERQKTGIERALLALRDGKGTEVSAHAPGGRKAARGSPPAGTHKPALRKFCITAKGGNYFEATTFFFRTAFDTFGFFPSEDEV
jgi:hypothetical protein